MFPGRRQKSHCWNVALTRAQRAWRAREMKNANARCTHVSLPCHPEKRQKLTLIFRPFSFVLLVFPTHNAMTLSESFTLPPEKWISIKKSDTANLWLFISNHILSRLPLRRFKNMAQSPCRRKCNSSFCIVRASWKMRILAELFRQILRVAANFLFCWKLFTSVFSWSGRRSFKHLARISNEISSTGERNFQRWVRLIGKFPCFSQTKLRRGCRGRWQD